jgi:hypothetical protein
VGERIHQPGVEFVAARLFDASLVDVHSVRDNALFGQECQPVAPATTDIKNRPLAPIDRVDVRQVDREPRFDELRRSAKVALKG